MYRKAYLTGIVAYAVMLFLAVLFYKERIVFLDTAFTVFNIIKDNYFCIQIFRFGDALNQLLPVIAAKSGLSLKTISVSYSAGFVLYYFSCYFITGTILRRYDFALVILLLNILFTSDTFYWIPSELPQGIAFIMLLFALLSSRRFTDLKPITWVVLLLSLVTLAFFHPLLIFVVVYCVLYFIGNRSVFTDSRFLYLVTGFYFFSVLLKATAFKTQYEAHSLSGLKNFVTQFPDYLTLYSNKLFLHNIFTRYNWIPLLFAAISMLYARRRDWKKLSFFVSFFIGYLFLVNITYPTSATPEFYVENLYLPLSVFLALPFVFELAPLLEAKKLLLPLIILIIVSGCARMYATHTTYTARLDYERKILDQYGEKKVFLWTKKEDLTALQMLWGAPYEFLLLSELERNKPASIIIDDNPLKRYWAVDTHQALITNWDVFRYKDIPKRYFQFTDTVSGYQLGAQR